MFLIKLTIVIFILFFQWQIHYEFYSGSQFVLIWRINWQYSIISLRSIYDSSQGKPFQRFYLFVDSWHGIHLSQKNQWNILVIGNYYVNYQNLMLLLSEQWCNYSYFQNPPSARSFHNNVWTVVVKFTYFRGR